MTDLTREQILALSGRQLSFAVAVHVMGYIPWEERHNGYTYIALQEPGGQDPYMRRWNWENRKDIYRKMKIEEVDFTKKEFYGCPDFAEDIALAWEVVEKVDIVEISKSYRANGEWYWGVCLKGNYTYAKFVPEAICKAAILEVMGL